MPKADLLKLRVLVLAILPAGTACYAQNPRRPPGPGSPFPVLKSLTGSIVGIETGPAALARERKAAQVAGMALFPRDLKRAPVPEARNAAPIYDSLVRLLKAKPLDPAPARLASQIASKRLSDSQLAQVRALLAKRSDVLDHVHRAAARPECYFQRDWALGAELSFGQYSTIREATRLLTAESLLLAHDGQWAKAVAHQVQGFRLAGHGASDPTVISGLIGNASHNQTVGGLAEILHLSDGNPTVAADVRKAVHAHPHQMDFRRILAGEVVMCVATLSHARKGDYGTLAELAGQPPPTPRKPLTAAERKLFLKLVDAGEADCLSLYRRAWDAAALPPSRRAAAFRQVEAAATTDRMNPTHLFRTIFIPMLSTLEQKARQAEARSAVLEFGAALLERHGGKGPFPKILAQTGVQAPADPFTGRPLSYRAEGKGFVVYSVGATGKFNGGTAANAEADRKKGEAVFRFPRVLPPAN